MRIYYIILWLYIYYFFIYIGYYILNSMLIHKILTVKKLQHFKDSKHGVFFILKYKLKKID